MNEESTIGRLQDEQIALLERENIGDSPHHLAEGRTRVGRRVARAAYQKVRLLNGGLMTRQLIAFMLRAPLAR